MQRFLIFLFVLINLQTYSQEIDKPADTTQYYQGNYLYLFSGKVIPGKSIELRSPVFGDRHFAVDDQKHNVKQVKFYQNDEGFFANTIQLQGLSSAMFCRRIKKGRINLYERTDFNNTPVTYGYAGTAGFGGHGTYGTTGGFGVGLALPQTKFYYNKGYNNLKEIDYHSLHNDMADDPLAISALNKWNKTRKNGNILMISGVVVTGVSLIALMSKTTEQKDPNVTGEIIGISFGVMAMWVKYFGWDLGANPKNLKKAIDVYNR